MIELNQEKAREFLNKNKIAEYKITKIAGDASFRSYYRIFQGDKNFILMFAPPTHEKIEPFINIDEFLVKNNFSAPKIFAIDYENGFILLEDFNDETYGRVLLKNNSKELEESLYIKASDCLIELHKIFEKPNNIALYNHDLLFRETMLFVDWYLKYIKKIELNLEEIKIFKKLWFDVFDLINMSDSVLVLRDFHADNLMILKNRNYYKSVGLLDFQDAVIGSKAYDLVSLLEDARRDVDLELVQKILKYYLQKTKIDEEKFLRDYEILSLQRNIKILGIFARLAFRDNKKNYLDLLPRVLNHVKNRIESKNLSGESFRKLTEFIAKFL